MLINRDAYQNGRDTFCDRRQLMSAVSVITPKLSIAVRAGKIFLEHKLAVFDQEHAVNIFVSPVTDSIEECPEQSGINVLLSDRSRVPAVIGFWWDRILIN